MEGRLRILLASPAYWPAHAFGGPVVVARELVSRLVARGHDVEVVTTTLTDVGERPAGDTRVETVDGARVTYLATPLRYRWMGITPTLPVALRRLARPDVTHVMGFRDPVTTGVAGWCRMRGVPYVFEPVGMFRPRLRKVRAQARVRLDADARGRLGRQARDRVVAAGARRCRRRRASTRTASGSAATPSRSRRRRRTPIRSRASSPTGAPVVLYVGRIAAEKGVEHLVEAARRLPDVHVVLAGPDDRHGRSAVVAAAQADPRTAGRVHLLPPTPGRRSTSTGAPTCSSSPRAARTSGSSPPRPRPSGRR